jgi:large subunit ribosomal protein L15
MPLQRRVSKRGFNYISASEYVAINVDVLNRFEDGSVVVDPGGISQAGIVKNTRDGIKNSGAEAS